MTTRRTFWENPLANIAEFYDNNLTITSIQASRVIRRPYDLANVSHYYDNSLTIHAPQVPASRGAQPSQPAIPRSSSNPQINKTETNAVSSSKKDKSWFNVGSIRSRLMGFSRKSRTNKNKQRAAAAAQTTKGEYMSAKRWSELAIVTSSGVADKMIEAERIVQERWFEIYQSELAYYKTLNQLLNIIMYKCKHSKSLPDYDFNKLFTKHVGYFFEKSKSILDSLEKQIKEELVIKNFFPVLTSTLAEAKFQSAYIEYAGQIYLQKEHYQKLLCNNKKFKDTIRKIFESKELECKEFIVYLIAPVQRLTRYKLLTDMMVRRLVLPGQEETHRQGVVLSRILDELLKRADRYTATLMGYAEFAKLHLVMNFEMALADILSNGRRIVYQANLVLISHTLEQSPVSHAPSMTSLNHAILSIEDAPPSSRISHNDDSALAPSFCTSGAQSSLDQFPIIGLGSVKSHLILFTDLLLIAIKEHESEHSFNYKLLERVHRKRVQIELVDPETTIGDEDETQTLMIKLKKCLCDRAKHQSTSQINLDPDCCSGSLYCEERTEIYSFNCTRYEGQIWLDHFSRTSFS